MNRLKIISFFILSICLPVCVYTTLIFLFSHPIYFQIVSKIKHKVLSSSSFYLPKLILSQNHLSEYSINALRKQHHLYHTYYLLVSIYIFLNIHFYFYEYENRMMGYVFYIISKLYKYKVKDKTFVAKKRRTCLVALSQKNFKYLTMNYLFTIC